MSLKFNSLLFVTSYVISNVLTFTVYIAVINSYIKKWYLRKNKYYIFTSLVTTLRRSLFCNSDHSRPPVTCTPLYMTSMYLSVYDLLG